MNQTSRQPNHVMALSTSHSFQGVACCCLDQDKTIQETINLALNLELPSILFDIPCYNLKLSNKYYKATINLFDYENLPENKQNDDNLLKDCHAVILFGNGQKLTTDELDQKVDQLKSIGGEPRILLYDGIDEDCKPFKTLREWSIKNGFDFLDINDEDIRDQMIDSLSAYKWVHRDKPSNESTSPSTPSVSTSADKSKRCSSNSKEEATKSNKTINNDKSEHENKPQLDGELLKKLMDFDSLLGKLSAYRERPDLRGDPNDKNIEEIAEILSGLLCDDVDKFLENEEEPNDVVCDK